MPSERRRRFVARATCAPGLEGVVADELRDLGIRPGPVGRGGVPFDASHRQLYTATLWLRAADRVLVAVIPAFPARTFPELEIGIGAIAWERFVPAGGSVDVRASARGSHLYHTGAVQERVRDAVAARVGEPARRPVDEARPPLRALVRIRHDRVTVSVDALGRPGWQRGWRGPSAKAPLRENLAAAALLASGWSPDRALVDPFCGSGTLVIEAARWSAGLPPGLVEPALTRWPSFEPGTWASVVGAAAKQRREPPAPLLGSDRDDGAVAAARTNAGSAEVGDHVAFTPGAVSDLQPPEGRPGWIVTNPPWGARLAGTGDLRNLYARLGDVVRERFAGWGVALVAADRRLANHSGLPLREQWSTTTGGSRVHLLVARPRRGRRAGGPS